MICLKPVDITCLHNREEIKLNVKKVYLECLK